MKTGRTGHAEAMRIVFDPKKLSLRGPAREVVLPHARPDDQEPPGQRRRHAVPLRDLRARSPEQRKAAEAVKARVDASGKWKRPVVTEIVARRRFTPAEDYHQDYLVKNPGGYTCHFLRS